MRLLVRWQWHAQRTNLAIVFKTQIQPPIQFVSQPRTRREDPSLLCARPTQRVFEDRVNVYLKAAEFLLDDRADFERHEILIVLPARKGDLGADAQINRQPPRFWRPYSRAEAPASEFVTGAGAMRRQQVNGSFKVIGDYARQFESQV